MADTIRYIDMLKDILQKQIVVLNAVLVITKEQSKVDSGLNFSDDDFADTLTKKDALIMRLNELDDGFVSIYNKVRRDVSGNVEQYKNDIKVLQDLIRKCTDLGMEIQTLEERNKEKIKRHFENRKQEYSAKQTAANVANKYSVTMRNVNLMGESYRFNQDK